MKICKNCSAVNDMSALKCNTCNMVGQFTPTNGTEEIQPEVQGQITCMNCGSTTPGEGKQCAHCRFPLVQARLKPLQPLKLQLYRQAI